MFKEIDFSEQGELVSDIIEALVSITATLREAFVHQQGLTWEEIDSKYRDLNEEIAFDAAIADELMFGKTLVERDPLYRYQDLLIHLQTVDKSLKLLADALRGQIKEGILLSDWEVGEVIMLLERQEHILRTLADVVRSGDGERLTAANSECRELSDSCRKIATSYETCLGEGMCSPKSANTLLSILGRVQAVVRNEVETAGVLAGWMLVRIAGGLGEQRA